MEQLAFIDALYGIESTCTCLPSTSTSTYVPWTSVQCQPESSQHSSPIRPNRTSKVQGQGDQKHPNPSHVYTVPGPPPKSELEPSPGAGPASTRIRPNPTINSDFGDEFSKRNNHRLKNVKKNKLSSLHITTNYNTEKHIKKTRNPPQNKQQEPRKAKQTVLATG